MADVTKMVQLPIAQWSRPGAEKPVLASPISATAQILTFTHPLLDENGAVITGNVLIGLKDRKGYTESIYIPPGGMSADGLTASGCIRGIDLSGLDYTTQNDSDLAVKHDADEPVICQISAVYINMVVQAVLGTIATGSNNLRVGNEVAADISYWAQNDHTTKPRVYFDDSEGYWKFHWGDNQPTSGTFILGGVFADLTEADTYPWPDNGVIIFAAGVTYFREGGAWIANQAGGSVPNATEAAAGKIRFNSAAQTTAATNTSGGDPTVNKPSEIAKAIQNNSYIYGASTTGNDTYVINPTPAIPALVNGLKILMKVDVANVGACTVNPSGLGAISIKKPDGSNPADGDIAANSIIELTYNSTGSKFQLETPVANTAASVVSSQAGSGNITTSLDISAGAGAFDTTVNIDIDVSPFTSSDKVLIEAIVSIAYSSSGASPEYNATVGTMKGLMGGAGIRWFSRNTTDGTTGSTNLAMPFENVDNSGFGQANDTMLGNISITCSNTPSTNTGTVTVPAPSWSGSNLRFAVRHNGNATSGYALLPDVYITVLATKIA